MVDPGLECVVGLAFGTALLLALLQGKVVVKLSEDRYLEAPPWAKKLVESKAGAVAEGGLALILFLIVGSIVGIVVWEMIKGVAGAFTGPSEVLIGAIVGTTASVIGFSLLTLVLSLFGPILFVAYEEWTTYVAPTIGGVVGAAISGGLGTNLILIGALGALTGGITLLFYGTITAKKRPTFKGSTELVIAGIGFGAINGVILGIFFKVLEGSVGLGWMLPG